MPSVSSVDSDDDDDCNFIFLLFPNELSELKENLFTLLMYTHCDLENLKVFFSSQNGKTHI